MFDSCREYLAILQVVPPAGIPYEPSFSGAVTGSTEMECSYCGELLPVADEDPTGERSHHCCECVDRCELDWGEGTVSYQ